MAMRKILLTGLSLASMLAAARMALAQTSDEVDAAGYADTDFYENAAQDPSAVPSATPRPPSLRDRALTESEREASALALRALLVVRGLDPVALEQTVAESRDFYGNVRGGGLASSLTWGGLAVMGGTLVALLAEEIAVSRNPVYQRSLTQQSLTIGFVKGGASMAVGMSVAWAQAKFLKGDDEARKMLGYDRQVRENLRQAMGELPVILNLAPSQTSRLEDVIIEELAKRELSEEASDKEKPLDPVAAAINAGLLAQDQVKLANDLQGLLEDLAQSRMPTNPTLARIPEQKIAALELFQRGLRDTIEERGPMISQATKSELSALDKRLDLAIMRYRLNARGASY